MNTIASQLGNLNLDYNDHDSIIDNDEERKDALGDLPDWENMSLTELKLDYCYYTKNGFVPLESLLGDGFWTGKPNWKGDAPTDSINELANREATMLKFFNEDEVKELYKHIKNAIEASNDERPWEAAESALQAVFEKAKTRRWAEAKQTKQAVLNLLKRLGYTSNTLNQLYERTVAYTDEVRARAENATNPSAYRKEQRDKYLEAVRSSLKLRKLFGRPWKFFNSLYWNTLFGWNELEPHQILSDCARRYAYSVNYDNLIHGD